MKKRNKSKAPPRLAKIKPLTLALLSALGPNMAHADISFSSFTINPGNSFTFAGVVTNTGALNINGNGALTTAVIDGDVTFNGTGTTLLGDSPANIIYGGNLTLDTGHTVRGGGGFGSATYGYYLNTLTNKGTIVADAASGMQIATNYGFTNNGIVKVNSGLSTRGAHVTNTGVFEIADGGHLNLNNSLSGGTIKSLGQGRLTGGTVSDVSLDGNFNIAGSEILYLSGNINHTGELNLKGSDAGFAVVNLTGNTTLSGNGTTKLGDDNRNIIYGNNLTIGSGYTVRGGGALGENNYYGPLNSLENQGTIIADAASGMQIATNNGFTNTGTVKMDTSLNVYGTYVQSGTNASTVVNGSLSASTLDIQSGQLAGSGVINGNVLLGAASVLPGNSPGTLTVNGDFTMTDTSELIIEALGNGQGISYDWLNVAGLATIDGTLRLNVGYSANVGDSFNFLTAGSIQGSFDQILLSGYQYDVSYVANGISLTITSVTPVPEVEAYLMFLAGLGLIGFVSRKKQAEVAIA